MKDWMFSAVIGFLIAMLFFVISSAVIKGINAGNYVRENYEKTEYVVIGNKGIITPVYKISEPKCKYQN